jgi:hypothetical protein
MHTETRSSLSPEAERLLDERHDRIVMLQRELSDAKSSNIRLKSDLEDEQRARRGLQDALKRCILDKKALTEKNQLFINDTKRHIKATTGA